MTKQNGIYKCDMCGNVVSVVEAHSPDIVCCGQPMNLLVEKTKDEGKEKHVPIVKINGTNVKIKIGSIPHPMEEAHFISLVQIIKEGKVIAGERLNPDMPPEVEFCLKNTDGIKARALCNVHGLWISQ